MSRFARSTHLLALAALTGTALAVVAPTGPAHAAGITVEITADNTTTDGNCTLREAIGNANNDAADSPDCPAGTGADVITLPAGTYVLGGGLGAYDPDGLTIDGAGRSSTVIDGIDTYRHFAVDPGTPLTLKDLRIEDGMWNSADGGGAILTQGDLTLDNVRITSSTASADKGGAIVVLSGGSLTAIGSEIDHNVAQGGGGIFVDSGTVTLTNSWMHDNEATASHGGAIRIDGSTSTVTITRSAIGPDNEADSLGAGILNNAGTLTIDRSALYGNDTSIVGSGGALFHDGENALTITNSTISGNTADSGGGLALFHSVTAATAVIASTTITGNTADVDATDDAFDDGGGIQISASEAPTVIRNSIIGDNTDLSPTASNKHADCSGTFTSQGYNLVESTTGCTGAVATDLTGQTPRLNALSSYTAPGQSPPFHSLQSTSPASDAGNPNTPGGAAPACLLRDQANAWRPYDGPDAGVVPRCDIGAREGGVPILRIVNDSRPEGDDGTSPLTFRLRLNVPSLNGASVDWATADVSADRGDDYRARSNTATIPAGATSTTVNVPVIGDRIDEFDETFFVNLSGATGARIADDRARGQIEDDDPRPKIRVLDDAVKEPGAGGTARLVFEVRLSRRSGKTVKVDFRTVERSATAPEDFVAKTGTLRFEPGQREKIVRVRVNPDTLAEGTERMRLRLFDLRHARFADDVAVGTINE